MIDYASLAEALILPMMIIIYSAVMVWFANKLDENMKGMK